MTNYSLRARMMILILAPTVLIGLLLSIFFVAHRYNDLQRQLEDAGASIIEPLAVSSEYGMNLQNRESIGQLISVLHRRHSEIVRAISVYDSHNRLFVTSNYQLNPSELQIPKGEAFPRHLSVIRDGDMMILRTPIVSESYSPDESPESDAKNAGQYAGLRRPGAGSKIGPPPAVQRDFYLQRNDAVLYRHRVNLRLEADARRHRANPQYG